MKKYEQETVKMFEKMNVEAVKGESKPVMNVPMDPGEVHPLTAKLVHATTTEEKTLIAAQIEAMKKQKANDDDADYSAAMNAELKKLRYAACLMGFTKPDATDDDVVTWVKGLISTGKAVSPTLKAVVERVSKAK